MSEITLDDVQHAARAVVHEYGTDYVYPGADRGDCYYFDGEDIARPSCLVGHIFARVDTDTCQRIVNGGYNREAVENLCGHDVLACDEATRDFLDRLQRRQDDGGSWGHALVYAESFMGE